jgi:FMN phosphatase YigB (HAD superfamily)
MRGEYTSETIVQKCAGELGIDYTYAMNQFVKSAQNMKFVSDKTPEIIKKLRNKGIKVVLITDNLDSFSRWTISAMHLDEIFDDILNSWDLKVLKSEFDEQGNSLFFSPYLKKHALKPQDCLIIDSLEDVDDKFVKLGFKYKKVSSPDETLPLLEGLLKK